MKFPKQQPPLSIQVELNEGCNLGCNFCGLRGMRKEGTKPWYPMSRETAKKIAEEIKRAGWHSRVIFSMHGEPTLNKDLIKIVKLFRSKLPLAVLSIMSNGYGFVRDPLTAVTYTKEEARQKIRALQAAGLTDLIIDQYSEQGDAATLRELLAQERDRPYQIIEFKKGVALFSPRNKEFRVLFTPPIQITGAINRHLCNHCGAAAPLDYSYAKKKCARPFREMTFRHDGSVCLCCNDFRGEYAIGNIMDTPIDEIWQDEKFGAARTMLLAGERSFPPCTGCNALSHRVGLLPDIHGQEKALWSEPTTPVRKLARSVSEGQEPLSTVYKRKWEK